MAVMLIGAACSASDTDTAVAPTDVVADLDVDLAGATTADVFAPDRDDLADAPVVVMLHGTAAERARLQDLARSVAAGGVLVYVPDWPAIDQVGGYPSDDDEPYRLQAEVVVCALRHVRLTATERGGDPDNITVYGHSGGAMAGARVAMVVDPPWAGIDCDAGTPHAPQRFIGSAGDYEGDYQMASLVPELYAPYDPTQIDPTNTDLEVRLIHGLSDDSVSADASSKFLGHVLEYGLDAQMLATDSGHGEMIDPSTPAGEFVTAQIVALVRGESSAFDLDGEGAQMNFDGKCNYVGPATFEVGRPIEVEFTTAVDPQVWFFAISVLAGSTVTDDEILATRDVPLDEPPEWVDHGGLVLIDQPGSETVRLIFLENDQRWAVTCMPDVSPAIPVSGTVLSPAG